MRYLPLIGVLLFLATAFGWRPWLHYRRYGSSGILLFRSSRPSQVVRDYFVVVWFVLLVGQAAAVVVFPDWLPAHAFGPATEAVQAAGAVLIGAGLVVLVTSQLQLGAAWRIGIDESASPGLVTTGLYRYSRNPIFLGALMILLGYALLIPTVLSLALLLGTYVGVRRQIAAEEKYLRKAYGEPYRDYARSVGRFLPWIGRRR